MVSVIILAAGDASRMNGIDKQLALLDGLPVIARSAAAFLDIPEIGEILIVCKPARARAMETALAGLPSQNQLRLLPVGGSTRQESVLGAIEALNPSCTHVAIHDGARPLVRREDICAVIEAAKTHGGAILACPVTDTVKRVTKDFIETTVDRASLWAAQTPQVFELLRYRQATAFANVQRLPVTDDAALFEAMGYPVAIVPGSPDNRKITVPTDLLIAEAMLQAQQAALPRREKL